MSGVRTSLGEVLGPLAGLLEETGVVEISLNPSGDVFVERFGAAAVHWGSLEAAVAMRFLRYCATWSKEALTEYSPIFSGRVPGTAHRIEGLVPPVVAAPGFSIRRHREDVVRLEEFVPDPEPRGLLEAAIRERRNILIAGSTGSGKTTLLNACLGVLGGLAPDTRLVVIEDTPEIRSPLANTIALRACEAASQDRLLASALRLAPDRIILGEVRSGAVLMTLLRAWHTGHPGGLSTLHANGAAEVPERLELLALEAVSGDARPLLTRGIDMVAFLRRGAAAPELATLAVRPARGERLETCYEA